MDEKEQEPSKKEKASDYVIDAGEIFIELQHDFKRFSTDFLRNTVWKAYQELVVSKSIFSISADDEHQRAYLNNQKEPYEQDWLNNNNISGFPFPDYYLYTAGKEVFALASFTERIIVGPGDVHYDLFFTLKLLQTDVMHTSGFLSFHWNEGFGKDNNRYTPFLKAISLKYDAYLKDAYTPLIDLFIETHKTAVKEDAKVEAGEPKGFTLNQQVLIMYFMFQKLGVNRNNVDLTNMARFVQGLTGRSTSATKIKNTDLYKRLSNPLKDKSKGSFTNDLIFVRNLFETLSLHQIVEEVNKEIGDRE